MKYSRRLFLRTSSAGIGVLSLSPLTYCAPGMRLSEKQKKALMTALESMESRYDSEEHMIKSGVSGVGYHTTLTSGTVHPTRTSLQYAAALYDSGVKKYKQRANDILRKVIPLQDTDPESKTYGIWSWYLEEPLEEMSPPDWNWADFCSAQLLAIWIHHQDELPNDLKAMVKESIIHAAHSIKRRNVGMGYTNIAIMGTYVTLAASEHFDIPEIKEYAQQRVKRLHRYILDQGSFNEYNSPTYTIVAIKELTRMIMHLRNQEALKLVNEMYDMAWKHAACRYHPPTGQWAGPHSRCYSNLLQQRESTLALLEVATGHQNIFMDEDPLPLGYENYRMDVRCPEKYIHYYEELEKPRTEIETFIKARGEDSPRVVGTTYLHPKLTLGTANHADYWNQRRPFISYWGDQENPGYLQVRFLHDDYDYSSAIPFTVQHKGCAISIVTFATNYGDTHISLDKVKDATIEANDLRLRFQFGGYTDQIIKENSLDPEKEIRLIDRDVRIIIKPLLYIFGESAFQWKWGEQEDLCFLDAIAYQGETRAIDFSQLEQAYLAFAFQILPKEEQVEDFNAVQTEQSDQKLSITWQLSDKTLKLSSVTKPMKIQDLRKQYQGDVI